MTVWVWKQDLNKCFLFQYLMISEEDFIVILYFHFSLSSVFRLKLRTVYWWGRRLRCRIAVSISMKFAHEVYPDSVLLLVFATAFEFCHRLQVALTATTLLQHGFVHGCALRGWRGETSLQQRHLKSSEVVCDGHFKQKDYLPFTSLSLYIIYNFLLPKTCISFFISMVAAPDSSSVNCHCGVGQQTRAASSFKYDWKLMLAALKQLKMQLMSAVKHPCHLWPPRSVFGPSSLVLSTQSIVVSDVSL